MQMQHLWMYLAVACIVIKVASTVYLVKYADRADDMERRGIDRVALYASKFSPIVLVLALLMQAVGAGNAQQITLYGWLLGFVVVLVVVVMYLRRKGRWYGLAHFLRKHRRDDDH